MKYLALLVLGASLFLQSCSEISLHKYVVRSVKVEVFTPDGYQGVAEITEKQKIDELIDSIEAGYREPLKFTPKYRLVFIYQDATKSVLVRDNGLKIEGRTFMSNVNIEEAVTRIIKEESK